MPGKLVSQMTPEEIDHARRMSRERGARNRERRNEVNRAWRAANPDKVRVHWQTARDRDPEKFAETRRRSRAGRVEKARATEQAWKQAHPEAQTANRNRRRARVAAAQGNVTKTEWRAIMSEFDGRCAYCNVASDQLEMEHMTPLSRGGSHSAANVVPACADCNRQKATRTLFEFAPRAVLKGHMA